MVTYSNSRSLSLPKITMCQFAGRCLQPSHEKKICLCNMMYDIYKNKGHCDLDIMQTNHEAKQASFIFFIYL